MATNSTMATTPTLARITPDPSGYSGGQTSWSPSHRTAEPVGRVNGNGQRGFGETPPDLKEGSGGGRRACEADFTLNLGDLDASTLRVTAFSGGEGLSELFHFHIEFCTDDGEIDLEAQLGGPARLQIAGQGRDDEAVTRDVHGIVQRVERLAGGARLSHYAADIVPVHWYLTKRHQSRIFQLHNCPDMSIPGIIRKVFADAGLREDSYRFGLQQTYEPRDYVVQYRETDMAFISRLMEEEGICYFFEHSANGHRMVIGDSGVAFAATPSQSEVVFREPTGFAPREEYAFDLRERREIQMGAVTLDDFDFKRPPLELRAAAAAERFDALELSDYPGKYTDRAPGDRYARMRLEEQQCGRSTLRMRATVRTLQPGYRFTLCEHPDGRLNAEYLVTHVEHVGRQSQSGEAEQVEEAVLHRTYEADARLLPSDVTYRPPRQTPRPVVQGSQTAIVVGPQTEEIFTDAYGRVKVQFHWDRNGAYDEKSSCWIRVSQGLAGGQYGAMFLPRVGQEVIVDFLEGDPDRPIITGSVYNNDHMPPYALPEHKTHSGIRTASTPGGGATNEIRFDDSHGAEELYFNASRDMQVNVTHDQIQSVACSRHATIGGADHEKVGQSRHTQIKLDWNQTVDGSVCIRVGGDVGEDFGGNHGTKVTNQYHLKAGQSVVLEAGVELTLKVGGNFIKIDTNGISILGSMVDINSGGAAGLATDVGLKNPENPLAAHKSDPGHNTRYSQEPPKAVTPAEPEKKTSWVEIELVDDLGRPCPNESFRIRTPDGKLIDGTLDRLGLAHVALHEPGACEICFPDQDSAASERV